MSGVYQIYNTVNGKRYIGSSIHIEQRFKEHPLREASRQLGIDKGAIQYCFKRKQGYCGKLNCTFIQISKEEYEEARA